jgi:hypothetical protein
MTLELTALGTWVGGLIVLIGSVIPAVFNTFGGQDSGGFFLTRSFEGYNRLVLIALAILVIGINGRAWFQKRGVLQCRVTQGEWIVLGLMTIVAGMIIFVLHPQAAALQAAAFALPGGEAKKAAFEAFFKLHWPMRALYVVNLGLGILLIGIRVRSWIDY